MTAGCFGAGDDDENGGANVEATDPDMLDEQLPTYQFLNNAQSYNPPRHDAINLMADQFGRIGLDMEVEVLEWGTLFNRVDVEYDYDFSLWHTFFTIDPVLELNSTMYSENTEPGQGNFAGYENPDADDLMDQYLEEPDADTRIDLVHDLQRTLMEDLPQMPVIDMPFLAVYNNEQVDNWEADLPHGFNSYWTMINLEMQGGEDTLKGYWPEALDTMNVLGHNDENKHTYNFVVIYDTLVRLDNEGEIDTDVSLATDYERVDATTMEYTIRDHTFHDGEPLTVEDIAFSYNYISENEVPVYSVQSNFIDEAEVVDDSTVRIHMPDDNPLGPFNLLVGTQIPILPEHRWADRDEPSQVNVEEPVGSGPLQFDYWDQGAELGLERFDDHFAPVDFEQRFWRIIPETSTVWENLRNGDLNYEPFGRIDRPLDENRDEDQISVQSVPATSFWHCTPNQRSDGLDDPEVRKAVFNAVPRSAIVDQILFGVPDPGFNVVTEAFGPLHTDDVTQYEEGVDIAIERLQDGGYGYDENGMLHFLVE
ncbi:ABC transporter substrate-binding protein [Natrialba hulunbeirensis JCM 10989]|uniref:ABC transporter substrate-binding protein n=1 Tax=Natrialba hulunbeirensis JCM 10989 TaxID=1227493 RepID=M0ABV3_9EURY|nr:ABC transporter substrate-binding protein [Natrialba hulunbeirensis]ELY96235.1 ABC transporter substrate-binding protein [Natrialba hulunbeirensis JCM 10989]